MNPITASHAIQSLISFAFTIAEDQIARTTFVIETDIEHRLERFEVEFENLVSHRQSAEDKTPDPPPADPGVGPRIG